jgi:Domain of unknown function (DUF1877)
MGMIAAYIMVDEKLLSSLMDLKNEELANKLFEIEESENHESIDIDKIWDALHFFLTGVSASEPIEGNELSEAIVGVHNFNIDDEDADFISCIENEELSTIITAIENFDFENHAKNFDPKILKKNKIYPNGIWEDPKEQLISEFKEVLNEILEFYRKALSAKQHIVISIL